MKLTGCTWTAVAVIVVLGCGDFAAAQNSTQNSRVLPKRLNPDPSELATPPLPPTPPGLPAAQAQGRMAKPAPPAAPTAAASVPPPVAPPPAPPPPSQLPNSIIAWDADTKEYTTKPGEMSAPFTFHFTNVSSGEVTLNSLGTSCGCTVAQLPPLPWKLPPGTNSVVPVTMNITGKSGVVFKTVTFNTDKGIKTLMVKVTIQPPPPPPTAGPMDRARNQEIAKADRQAVFKGDCARCHVEPAKGKFGKELYVAACGICHEAEHRATMVADLHAIKQDTNAEYWKTWIAHGKAGTLMPAFAQSDGGPLSEGEINSLVEYLLTAIAPHGTAHAGGRGAAN